MVSRTGRLLAAAAVALAFAAAGAGAQSRAQAERDRREREAHEREAELNLALAERLRLTEPEQRPAPRLNLVKVREDYVQLQVVNNELARVVAAGGEPDFKVMATAAAEIRKRAERLKVNLALPETPRDEKRPDAAAPPDLKATLNALDQLILRFVRNPFFTDTKRFDLKHSATVGRELKEIIELSGRVRKMCEKSRAAARKPE
jgi:hypothetical protein